MFGDKPKDVPQPFALILVPEFTMMPVTSAIEPLRLANRMSEKALYRWTMHSVDGQPVAASNNILTMVNGDLETVPPHATIIVCAGLNVQHHSDKRLISWLRKTARRGNDIGAVCTGAHLLAEAGILDDYKCTIHWENLPGFSEAFPEINATGGLFEIDRDRFTSAGGTTALDMMLTMIASQHGPDLASALPKRSCIRPSAITASISACRCPPASGRGIRSSWASSKRWKKIWKSRCRPACWQNRRDFRRASSSACSGAMWTARPSAITWNCA